MCYLGGHPLVPFIYKFFSEIFIDSASKHELSWWKGGVHKVWYLGGVVGKDDHIEVSTVVMLYEVVRCVGVRVRPKTVVLMLPQGLVESKENLQHTKYTFC